VLFAASALAEISAHAPAAAISRVFIWSFLSGSAWSPGAHELRRNYPLCQAAACRRWPMFCFFTPMLAGCDQPPLGSVRLKGDRLSGLLRAEVPAAPFGRRAGAQDMAGGGKALA
jgi:hypothetical protein